jgi:hypothetical protein
MKKAPATIIVIMIFLAITITNAEETDKRDTSIIRDTYITDDVIDLRKLNARYWWNLTYTEKLCFTRGYILGATATEAWLEKTTKEDNLSWQSWMSLYNIEDKKLIQQITYFYNNYDPSIPIVVPIYKYLQEVK